MSGKLAGVDKIVAQVNKIIKDLDAGNLSVGFMGGEYPNNGPLVAAVAFWNEFGVPSHNQPARPFFRRMIAKESPGWGVKIAQLARANNLDGKRALNQLGEDIKGALHESIAALMSPALSTKTAAAKGSPKPLVETAQMLNSIKFKVE